MAKLNRTVLAVLLAIGMILTAACAPTSEPQASGEPAAPENTQTTDPAQSTPAQEGTGESEEPAPDMEKSIRIAISNDIVTFNPLLKNSDYLDLVFLPLVELDNDGEFKPMLAKEIVTEDNKVFTVKLNDVKWSDGTPVTADDVIYTITMFCEPLTTSLFASAFNIIEGTDDTGYSTAADGTVSGVVKVDDTTITITTKQPIAMSTFYNTVGIKTRTLPKHILGDVNPADLEANEFFTGPSVTNGAYLFVEHASEQYTEFEANVNFYKGVPKVGRVFLIPVETTSLTMKLETGEIDMCDSEATVSFDDFERLMSNEDLVTNAVNSVNGNTVIFINNEVIPDARVRRAINIAIDRESIINGLMKGMAENSATHFIMSSPYYDAAHSTPVYDPELAKQLLAEAGWDSDTVIKFDVGSGNKAREQSADMIVQQLAAVGVKLEIQKMEFKTLLTKARAHDFEMTILTQSTNLMMSDFSNVLSTTGSFNLSVYSNAEMDKLLADGLVAVDEAERSRLYSEVQRIYAQDCPVFAVYQSKNLFVRNKKVISGESQSLGMYINPHLWDIEK